MPKRVSTGTPTDRAIAALIHELTTDGDITNLHGWSVDRQYNQPDRLTVTFIIDSERLDQALNHALTNLGRTVRVPLIDVPTRAEQPRAEPADPGDTLVIGAATADLAPISHAPTTCIYPVRIGGSNDTPPCGELIRWTGGEWVHVSDPQLGQSDHPATPGQ